MLAALPALVVTGAAQHNLQFDHVPFRIGVREEVPLV
jgi:hypothetical protein